MSDPLYRAERCRDLAEEYRSVAALCASTEKRFIDRFIFVVEWGQTKRSLVLEALSEAQTIRERVTGIALNKADPFALRSIEAYKGEKFRDYYRE